MRIDRVFWLKSDGSVKEITEEHPDFSKKGDSFEKFMKKYWCSGKSILIVFKNGDWFMWNVRQQTPIARKEFELKKSHLEQLRKLLKWNDGV